LTTFREPNDIDLANQNNVPNEEEIRETLYETELDDLIGYYSTVYGINQVQPTPDLKNELKIIAGILKEHFQIPPEMLIIPDWPEDETDEDILLNDAKNVD